MYATELGPAEILMADGVKFKVWLPPVTVTVAEPVTTAVVPEFAVNVHLDPPGTIAVLEGMDIV